VIPPCNDPVKTCSEVATLCGLIQHIAIEVGGLPEPSVSIAMHLGLVLDQRDEFRKRTDLQRSGHRQSNGSARNLRNGLKVLNRIVLRRLVENCALYNP